MNVYLQANSPVDLYDETGIAVGTKLIVSSNYEHVIRLSTSETGLNNDFVSLYQYKQAENQSGDTGAWAISPLVNANINVREA